MGFPQVYLPVQGAYDQQANGFAEDYDALLRRMSRLPEPMLPTPAGLQFDPKQMLIGSILAGLAGGGEGANAFLQGSLQGKLLQKQQADQRNQELYRRQKLEQDRQLGILRTEAEIANRKMSQAFQRARDYRGDVNANKREEAILGRQKAQAKELAIRQAEDDIRNAKTPEALDIAYSSLKRAGGQFDPWQYAAQRGSLKSAADLARQDAQTKLYLPSLLKEMSGGKSSSVRMNAANKVYGLLQRDPNHFLVNGMDPAQIEEERRAAVAAAGELRIDEKLGLQRIQDLLKSGKLKDAQTLLAGANMERVKAQTAEQKILNEHLPEKIRLAAQKARADIAKVKTSTAAPGTKTTTGKPLTANEFASSTRQYTLEIEDINQKISALEAENKSLASIKQLISDGKYKPKKDEDTGRTSQQIDLQMRENVHNIDVYRASQDALKKNRDDLANLRNPQSNPFAPVPVLSGPIGGAMAGIGVKPTGKPNQKVEDLRKKYGY